MDQWKLHGCRQTWSYHFIHVRVTWTIAETFVYLFYCLKTIVVIWLTHSFICCNNLDNYCVIKTIYLLFMIHCWMCWFMLHITMVLKTIILRVWKVLLRSPQNEPIKQ
jgi:hypothetical protein